MAQNIDTPQSASAGANENNAGLSSFQYLPPRQQEVFDLLLAFTKKNGYPPTNRELANLIGVRSANAIAEHIRALERKGFVSVAVVLPAVLPLSGKMNRRWLSSCSVRFSMMSTAQGTVRSSSSDCMRSSHEEKLVCTFRTE